MKTQHLISILILPLAILLSACADPEDLPPGLRLPPWSMESTPDGNRVLGVIPGKTSLGEASKSWVRVLEFAVFREAKGKKSLEAFAGKLKFGGVEGRLVLPLKADEATLERYVSGSPNKKPQQSGAFRFTVDASETESLLQRKIERLVFVPAFKNLEAEVLEARFGKPEQKLEQEAGREIWMYPTKGLLISLDPEGREAFHFTEPARFGEMRELLTTE